MDMVPFMQIAGDVAPDVMRVNFRQSQTYIDLQLLFPLEHYVELAARASLVDGGAMPTEAYLTELKRGSGWEQIALRVPRQCWPHSGRTTALNAATCCASLSSIAAVQQAYGLVADVLVSLYGSEGWGSSPSERAQLSCAFQELPR